MAQNDEAKIAKPLALEKTATSTEKLQRSEAMSDLNSGALNKTIRSEVLEKRESGKSRTTGWGKNGDGSGGLTSAEEIFGDAKHQEQLRQNWLASDSSGTDFKQPKDSTKSSSNDHESAFGTTHPHSAAEFYGKYPKFKITSADKEALQSYEALVKSYRSELSQFNKDISQKLDLPVNATNKECHDELKKLQDSPSQADKLKAESVDQFIKVESRKLNASKETVDRERIKLKEDNPDVWQKRRFEHLVEIEKNSNFSMQQKDAIFNSVARILSDKPSERRELSDSRRTELASTLVEDIYKGTTTQGHGNACAEAVITSILSTTKPDVYANSVANIVLTGHLNYRGVNREVLSSEILNAPDDEPRSAASNVFIRSIERLAAEEEGKGTLAVDGNGRDLLVRPSAKPELFPGTKPQTVSVILSEIAGLAYKDMTCDFKTPADLSSVLGPLRDKPLIVGMQIGNYHHMVKVVPNLTGFKIMEPRTGIEGQTTSQSFFDYVRSMKPDMQILIMYPEN